MKLDKARLVELLRAADHRWYRTHPNTLIYSEHINFTAEYLARNYKLSAGKKGR